ncbi:MAG: Ig-like domain-containing protein [Planctomycetes bacterium]|nr:Ig-like domain-containing protein [Planctomycetota bacterium]
MTNASIRFIASIRLLMVCALMVIAALACVGGGGGGGSGVALPGGSGGGGGGGSGNPKRATNPSPADGALDVNPTTLTWSGHADATSFDVYFGTAEPLGALTTGTTGVGIALTTTLNPATTYKWRVDSTLTDSTVVTGDTWTFTTPAVSALAVSSSVPSNGSASASLAGPITITMSKPVLSSSVNTTNITLAQTGGAAVTINVLSLAQTITCTLSASLAPSTPYTLTVSGVQGSGGETMAGPASISFTTTSSPVYLAFSPVPGNDVTGVSQTPLVQAIANVPLDPTTVTTNNITFSGFVSGTVTFTPRVQENKLTLTIGGSGMLGPNELYVVVIKTAVQGAAGEQLSADFTFKFTTGSGGLSLAFSTFPHNAAQGVSSSASVTAVANIPLNAATVTTANVTFVNAGGTAVAGYSVSESGGVITVSYPSGVLQPSTMYTVTISTSVLGAGGEALVQNVSWSFTIAASAMELSLTPYPQSNAQSVPLNSQISVYANVNFSVSTANSSNITLTAGTQNVGGLIIQVNANVVAIIAGTLTAGTTYTVTVRTTVQGVGGETLPQNYTYSFSTVSALSFTTTPTANQFINGITPTITATASVNLNPTTVTTSAVLLTHTTSGAQVTQIAVSVSGAVISVTLHTALVAQTSYTVTIVSSVKGQNSESMSQNFWWSFTTGNAPTTLAFTSDPANSATGVSVSKTIVISANTNLSVTTVNSTSLTMTDQSAGVVNINRNVQGPTITITYPGTLAAQATYTITITTAVQGASGETLAANHVIAFTTAAPSPLQFAGNEVPTNNSTSVALNANIQAGASIPLNASTVNSTSCTLTVSGGAPVTGYTVSVIGQIIVFNYPQGALSTSTTYTATIGTAVTGSNSETQSSAFSWSFTTANPLTVSSTVPTNGATLVNPATTGITINFSDAMTSASCNSTTITLTDGAGTIIPQGTGSPSVAGNVVTVTPASTLPGGSNVTCTIAASVTSVTTLQLGQPYVFTFTTSVSTTFLQVGTGGKSFSSATIIDTGGQGGVQTLADCKTLANGNSFVIYHENVAGVQDIYVSVFLKASGWQTPVKLSSGGVNLGNNAAGFARDAYEKYLVAWWSDGTHTWVAPWDPSTNAFLATQKVNSTNQPMDVNPMIEVFTSGDFVTVWLASGTDDNLYYNYYTKSSATYGGQVPITLNTGSSAVQTMPSVTPDSRLNPRMVFDQQGRGFLMFVQTQLGVNRLRASIWSAASTAFGSPANVDHGATATVDDFDISRDNPTSGDRAIVYDLVESSSLDCYAIRWNASAGTIGTPVKWETAAAGIVGTPTHNVYAGMPDTNGVSVLVSHQDAQASGSSTVRAATWNLASGAVTLAPASIANGSGDVLSSDFVTIREFSTGDALVAFREVSGARYRGFANVFSAGAFAGASQISMSGKAEVNQRGAYTFSFYDYAIDGAAHNVFYLINQADSGTSDPYSLVAAVYNATSGTLGTGTEIDWGTGNVMRDSTAGSMKGIRQDPLGFADIAGNALVLFLQSDGTNFQLRANHYDQNSGLWLYNPTAPGTNLSTATGTNGDVKKVVADIHHAYTAGTVASEVGTGEVTVAFAAGDGVATRVYAVRFR